MKKIKFNSNLILKPLIIIILALSIIYLVISIINLIPFGIQFVRGEYSVDNASWPNYSGVFNSIFSVIGIIISGCFSWMVYKINNEQKNNNYNINVASPAATIYYIIKFYLLSCLTEFLKKNKTAFKKEEYKTKSGEINEVSDIIFYEFPRANTQKIQENLFKIIGELEDPGLRHTLYTLVEDVSNNRNIIFILRDHLVDFDKGILIETGGKVWLKVFYDIFNDNWNEMGNDYNILMKKLFEISKSRK